MSALEVQTYSSPEMAFAVNSHLIEAPDGIIIVDTQFLISQARMVEQAVVATGKKLAAIIITHPHPDHFNGTGILRESSPDVPVYATEATVNGIQAIASAKREQWTPIYKEDYPQEIFLPTHLVASGSTVNIAGIDLKFEDIGAMESANQTIVYSPESQTLFSGDLIYHQVHPWLAEGRSSAWLESIKYVRNTYGGASTVYPGHGSAPTTLAALDEQEEYINFFRSLINAALASSTDSQVDIEQIKNQVSEAIGARYPDWPLAMLHGWNTEGIVAELQKA